MLSFPELMRRMSTVEKAEFKLFIDDLLSDKPREPKPQPKQKPEPFVIWHIS